MLQAMMVTLQVVPTLLKHRNQMIVDRSDQLNQVRERIRVRQHLSARVNDVPQMNLRDQLNLVRYRLDL